MVPHVEHKGDPALARWVGELFGTSDRLVVRAVFDFLRRSPGSLDLHNLQYIAASTRLFDDLNNVAYMIDALDVTQMDIAAAQIDRETVSRQLHACTSTYGQVTRRRLILDLIETSTAQVLDDCPRDRVSDAGKEALNKHLQADLGKTISERVHAVRHPFASIDITRRALDQVEARIDRVQAKHPAGHFPEADIEQCLLLLGAVSEARSPSVLPDAEAERAWRLFERLPPASVLSSTFLWFAVENEQIVKSSGARMAQLICPDEGGLDFQRLRERMLSARELSEESARRLVASGVGSSVVDGVSDCRLGFLRFIQYSQDGPDLPRMSSEEIDRRLAELPPARLAWGAVAQMQDSDALDLLARSSSSRLDYRAFDALINHPALPKSSLQLIIDECMAGRRSGTEYEGGSARRDWSLKEDVPIALKHLLTCRALDDAQLSKIIETSSRAGKQSLTAQMVGLAAMNIKAGPRVAELFRQTWPPNDDERRLTTLAERSASGPVLSALASRAVEDRNRRLAHALISNGMLRSDDWQNLTHEFVGLEARDIVLESRADDAFSSVRTYDSVDVAELVISGNAAPGRHEALVEAVSGNFNLVISQKSRLHRLPSGIRSQADGFMELANAGLVPDVLADGTGALDSHVALTFATHPGCSPQRSRYRLPAEYALAETVSSIEVDKCPLPPEKGLRSWKALPTRDDRPLPHTPWHDLIRGREVGGLKLQMPQTRRQLKELSASMHNCLGGFVRAVARGTHLVAYAHDDDETYAVMWDVKAPERRSALERSGPERARKNTSASGRELHVVEMNSRFNGGNVPGSFRGGIVELTDQVNSGSIAPVEKEQVEPQVVEADTADREAGDQLAPVRRPRRRREALVLATDDAASVAGPSVDGARSSAPPSLLSTSGQDAPVDSMTDPIESVHEVIDLATPAPEGVDNSLT